MSRRDKLPTGIDKTMTREGPKYRARVFYRGRQYMIGSFYTVQDAKTSLAIARSQIAQETFVPPRERRRAQARLAAQEQAEGLTVREWSALWLESLDRPDRSPGTVASYRSSLNSHVLPVLGSHRLVDVRSEDVDKLVSDVRASKGSWTNVARTLRAMFRAALAADVGGLKDSPVNVSIPKPAKARTLASDEIPSPAQVRALAAAMPDELAVAVDLAAWCALRLGEVLGLQRRDLEHLDDPDRAVLNVRRQWLTKASPPEYAPPKAGSARTVAIPASLVPRLRDHVDRYAGPGREGPVVPSSRDRTKPVSQTTFDRAWRTARETVGANYRFHDLRHTGLTTYARQGATLSELMHRGGHTNVEAALRYQHSAAVRDRELTAKLDAAMGGDGV